VWRIEHPRIMVAILVLTVSMLALQLQLNTLVLDQAIFAIRVYRQVAFDCLDRSHH
jgi:hypothetical protein